MASSSSSSENNAIVPNTDEPPSCFCRYMAKLRESWKPDNPARRFYNCSKSLISADACSFFKWVDPTLNNHYDRYKDTILGLKTRVESMNSSSEFARLQQKVLKLKSLRQADQEIAAVELENAALIIKELQTEVGRLKQKNKTQLILAVICVLTVVVFGKLF